MKDVSRIASKQTLLLHGRNACMIFLYNLMMWCGGVQDCF